MNLTTIYVYIITSPLTKMITSLVILYASKLIFYPEIVFAEEFNEINQTRPLGEDHTSRNVLLILLALFILGGLTYELSGGDAAAAAEALAEAAKAAKNNRG